MWYAARLVHQAAVGPQRVASVGDGQVAGTELVEHPQDAETRSDRVTALDSN